MKIDDDRLFQELLSTFFFEFLALFLPEVVTSVEPESLTFLDKEVFTDVTVGKQYEANLIAKVRFRAQKSCFFIHIENQATAQSNFDRRMFRYFARLYEKFALPVFLIALFSYDAPRRLESNCHQVAFPDFEV